MLDPNKTTVRFVMTPDGKGMLQNIENGECLVKINASDCKHEIQGSSLLKFYKPEELEEVK
jgi:hypothetical protein